MYFGTQVWPVFIWRDQWWGLIFYLSAALFDGVWLGLFRCQGLRLFTKPFFWKFLFAWIAADAIYLIALFCFEGADAVSSWLANVIPAIERDGILEQALGLALLTPGLVLVWLRLQLILWPLHVLASGTLGDLATPRSMLKDSLVDMVAVYIGLAASAAVVGMAFGFVAITVAGPESAYVVYLLTFFLWRAMINAVY